MALVSVIHCPNSLVSASIIHDKLLVTATNDTDSGSDACIVERECWDVLGRRVSKRLQELVETALLQSFHVILHFLTKW